MQIPDELLAKLVAHLPPGHTVDTSRPQPPSTEEPPSTEDIRRQFAQIGSTDRFDLWRQSYAAEIRAGAVELAADELGELDVSKIIAATDEADPWYGVQAAVVSYLFAWAEEFRSAWRFYTDAAGAALLRSAQRDSGVEASDTPDQLDE
jgi:hypothetical protein